MRTLLISLMAVGLFAASSCVNEGGQVFGELPEGVVPVSGEALEARGAVYNKDLNELKISWRTTLDPKLYKGVEVSFQALGGQSKTIRIMANPNFSSSYDYFTVVTKNPATVQYRCIWDKESGEEVSEWASADNLTVTNVASSDVFFDIVPPTFKLVTEDNVSAQVAEAYDGIVGKTDEEKKAYYTQILQIVLSSIYNSTVDAGQQPVSWIKCILGKMDYPGAVAYVSGDSEGPLMRLSSEYVEQVSTGAVSMEDATFEIRGVLIHEFSHLVQKTGAVGSNQPSCIEGMADAIRSACGGVTDANRISGALNAGVYYDENRKSGDTPCPYVWQMPYGTSGYFMNWLRTYDGDFLRKMTITIEKMGSQWSLEKAVQYILGENYKMEDLWNEYIEDAKSENVG
ncbi:basic secretory protein-like protein [Phocaeicola coprocola]|uniref:basic secretory protein-like protein n=1 Tax=Phocaeicola coprocola TaxID=310298 RepID=UPI001C37F623|nr:basic secretory protein-like protein [Phocaeicola coprocola]MBV3868610.1 basic secretory family protein [Phocaeicola coprocola]MBV4009750.1 basic secretory family protein [Phocaeicola coprocola]MBV4034230.1 basic secretory family protein [Phocaeicola coprocola]MBV4040825.1 basic secretory family protein [Phocaeicola coprocola]MBV4062390.1 basic secretory family protein [Phocaeicola coprocola]